MTEYSNPALVRRERIKGAWRSYRHAKDQGLWAPPLHAVVQLIAEEFDVTPAYVEMVIFHELEAPDGQTSESD